MRRLFFIFSFVSLSVFAIVHPPQPEIVAVFADVDGASLNGTDPFPFPAYYSDSGKPNRLWSELLATNELKKYVGKRKPLTIFSLRKVFHGAPGRMGAQVLVKVGAVEHSVVIDDLPAHIFFAHLRREQETLRHPKLPFPVEFEMTNGSRPPLTNVELDRERSAESQRELKAMADFLKVPMQRSAYSPSSPGYTSIGSHDLLSIRIIKLRISVYGDLEVSFVPVYGSFELLDDTGPVGNGEIDPKTGEVRHLVFRQLFAAAPAPKVEHRYYSFWPDKSEVGFVFNPKRPDSLDAVAKAGAEMLRRPRFSYATLEPFGISRRHYDHCREAFEPDEVTVAN